MRNSVFFAALFLLSAQASAQVPPSLETINSDSTVQAFLNLKTADARLAESGLLRDSAWRDTEFRPWSKADFDGDGEDDLLVHIGAGLFGVVPLIFYSREGWTSPHTLLHASRLGTPAPVARFIPFNSRTAIQLLWAPNRMRRPVTPGHADTLVFRFGAPVEYTAFDTRFPVHFLHFEASPCFGSCPWFRYVLVRDSLLFWDAVTDNSKHGRFYTVLPESERSELLGLLNAIQLPALLPKYNVPWTDDPTGTIDVWYGNYRRCRVEDYGMIGTFGLQELYRRFFDWRDSLHWMPFSDSTFRKVLDAPFAAVWTVDSPGGDSGLPWENLRQLRLFEDGKLKVYLEGDTLSGVWWPTTIHGRTALVFQTMREFFAGYEVAHCLMADCPDPNTMVWTIPQRDRPAAVVRFRKQ